MTIQIKRGNTADRPNPLLNGEFGWDADTRRLWIGNGVVNENLFVAGAAVTTDFSVYVCTAALGGGAADADGLAKNSGTATATIANKLVDGAASFDSSYVNKTVYNKTDDTWAKITAVDDANTLSLSANIMAVGDSYETTNAFSSVADGFAAVPGPYSANVTLRISPGTFSDDVTFIGKIAAGSKTLTVQGSTTGTTTIDGAVEISQKITINNITFSDTTINANYGAEVTWANCPLSNTRLNTKNGSDLTWDNCDGSGTTKLYTYIGSKNLIENTVITVGNNLENITSINSTITKGYTIYVATTALGGNDAVADGLAITNGTATSTTTNKLVDSGAAFTSTLVGKTVWNSTDDTWAKVNAVDSATQLSLSADIMASGEGYVIANAFSTIQGAVNSIPGTVNCDIKIKVSSGTFAEQVTVQGKQPSGAYTLTVSGVMSLTDSGTCTSATDYSSGTQAVFNDTGKSWTVNAYADKILRLTGGTGYDATNTWKNDYIIESNTATQLTLAGKYFGVPASGTTYEILDFATVMDGSSHTINSAFDVVGAQAEIALKFFKGQNYLDTHFYVRNGATASAFTLHSAITASAGAQARGIRYDQGALCPNANCIRVDSVRQRGFTIINGAKSMYDNATNRFGLTNSLIKAINPIEIAYGAALNYGAGYGNKLIVSGGNGPGLFLQQGAYASIYNFIIDASSGAAGAGVYANQGSDLLVWAGNDIFGAPSHGIDCSMNSSVWAFSSGSKSRNNGGWGMSTSLSSAGKSITTNISFTGNASGTYTADSSSINT